jgi:ParB family transcriptional regulator, chromosome partitioning protein
MTTTAEKLTTEAEKTVPEKRKALGRGLESLLPSGPRVVPSAGGAAPPPDAASQSTVLPEVVAQAHTASGQAVVQISLQLIAHNHYQTRYHFEKDALEELAESIKANGVVQPIVVRPGTLGRFLLILGERRCRASKLAGKTTIPAIVRKVSEQQAAEMTVVENLQRQDLNCMEQAAAFGKLSRDFGLTQEQIGQRVGVSRESVSNYMRLLKLPGSVVQYLQEGVLSFSEARELLKLPDNETIATIAQEAVEKHLSFYQLMDRIEGITIKIHHGANGVAARGARWVDPNVRAVQTEMERALGMRVRIRDRKGKGKIVIEYATLEDFDRVVEMLKGKN